MENEKVLRVVIVGCGRIAGGYDEEVDKDCSIVRTHAKAYQLQPDTQLVAVMDVNKNRAQSFSFRWDNPEVYTDLNLMLSETKPDIVSICTPDQTHADMLELCLDYPHIKAIWCEKPLSTEIERAETIVSAFVKRGTILAVNYQRRWSPELQEVKKAIKNGDLGNIQKAVVFYTKGIYHNGSHAIDLLIDWLGSPAESQVFGSLLDFKPTDPTLDARIVIGKTPVYLIGVDEREYSLFEIQIMGTSGRVNVNNSGREVEWFQRQPNPDFKGYRILQSEGSVHDLGWHGMMADALKEILQAISTGQVVRSNGESALKTLRVCHNLAEQTKT